MTTGSSNHDDSWRRGPIAVLVSGGPDSAVLVGELIGSSPQVVPIYVRMGSFWEIAEEHSLREFLQAIECDSLKPLVTLEMPIGQVYGNHWSITGRQVPDAVSPDAAVFLPGRNLLLLAQTSIWCNLHKVSVIALGLLKGNPFPDSSDAFFASCQTTINTSLDAHLKIVRPYQHLNKVEVLIRGRSMPLELTWSCIMPVNGSHCGQCNKCAERRKAFRDAGLEDSTVYAI